MPIGLSVEVGYQSLYWRLTELIRSLATCVVLRCAQFQSFSTDTWRPFYNLCSAASRPRRLLEGNTGHVIKLPAYTRTNGFDLWPLCDHLTGHRLLLSAGAASCRHHCVIESGVPSRITALSCAVPQRERCLLSFVMITFHFSDDVSSAAAPMIIELIGDLSMIDLSRSCCQMTWSTQIRFFEGAMLRVL